jgi:hypothetical protein
VKDHQIDALVKAAQIPEGYDPAKLESVAEEIRTTMRPVRPMARTGLITGGLMLFCAGVAMGGAVRAGLFGVARMSIWDRALIFPLLIILMLIAAREFASAMIPGSRRYASAGTLVAICALMMIAAFVLLFRDYGTAHFISVGMPCLTAGLVHACIAGCLAAWLVRRGFAVRPASAGSIAGTMAGLTGLGMLELHCPNFQVAHVLIWHISVVLLSAAAGSMVAQAWRNVRTKML